MKEEGCDHHRCCVRAPESTRCATLLALCLAQLLFRPNLLFFSKKRNFASDVQPPWQYRQNWDFGDIEETNWRYRKSPKPNIFDDIAKNHQNTCDDWFVLIDCLLKHKSKHFFNFRKKNGSVKPRIFKFSPKQVFIPPSKLRLRQANNEKTLIFSVKNVNLVICSKCCSKSV